MSVADRKPHTKETSRPGDVMGCPDENFFARVQARLLLIDEAAAFHRHLDECPDCLRIAASLGCIADERGTQSEFAESTDVRPTERKTVSVSHGATRIASIPSRLVFAFMLMILAHAYWSYTFIPLARELPVIQGAYILSWGTLGLGVGGVAFVLTLKRQRWARIVSLVYMLVSLPTISLSLPAWCLWREMRPE